MASSTDNSNDSLSAQNDQDQTRDGIDTRTGIIAWFVRNSVAANLLMIFIVVGGFLTISTINKQMFPQVKINWLN